MLPVSCQLVASSYKLVASELLAYVVAEFLACSR